MKDWQRLNSFKIYQLEPAKYIYIYFLYYNLTLPLEPIEMKCLENCVTFFSFNPESKIHVEIINVKIIVSPPPSYVTNQL